MDIQEKIKAELIKEINSNIDNIYDFIESRYSLDAHYQEQIIQKLNELKDVVYKSSQFCELA